MSGIGRMESRNRRRRQRLARQDSRVGADIRLVAGRGRYIRVAAAIRPAVAAVTVTVWREKGALTGFVKGE